MTSDLCGMRPSGPELALRELSYRLEQHGIPVLATATGQYICGRHCAAVDALVAEINDDLCRVNGGRRLRDDERLHIALRPDVPSAETEGGPPTLPDTITRGQREVLTTLRALAGLVAHAIRQKAALVDDRMLPGANAPLAFWRDMLLRHTRRLLPTLISGADQQEARLFAERLVRAAYQEDAEAVAHHGCDPLICTHEAHREE